jgi:hypothetical protein
VGRLIDARDFDIADNRLDHKRHHLDRSWYFAEPAHSKLIDSYPEVLTIHVDTLDGSWAHDRREAGERRIAIRKFVERMMDTDVVWKVEHLTHIRVFPKHESGQARNMTRIVHGYYHFHFEDLASATHFKFRFGELCKPISRNNPSYPSEPGCDDFFEERDMFQARQMCF